MTGKGNCISASEAAFIGFWRSVYQGCLPDRPRPGGKTPSTISGTALQILRRDMVKVCLRFLLTEGQLPAACLLPGEADILPHTHLTGMGSGEETLSESTWRDAHLRFRFSADFFRYMISVYNKQGFDPSGKSFTVADGLLLVILLERLHNPDGSTSPLFMHCYFLNKTLSELIAAMPMVQLLFFDYLPEDYQTISLMPGSRVSGSDGPGANGPGAAISASIVPGSRVLESRVSGSSNEPAINGPDSDTASTGVPGSTMQGSAAPACAADTYSEPTLFFEILSALIPYITKRWLAVESRLWWKEAGQRKPDQSLAWVVRLSDRRGELASQIFKLCRENGRLEILTSFAVLTRRLLEQDFYDTGRAMPQITEALDSSIRSCLRQGEPAFVSFYNRRGAYLSGPAEIADTLDALGKSSAMYDWSSVEVFSFLFDLPVGRIRGDLIELIIDRRSDNNGLRLDALLSQVTACLKKQITCYMQEFFYQPWRELESRLLDKFRKLSGKRKQEIRNWILEHIPHPRIDEQNPYSEAGAYSWWLLMYRIRTCLEARSPYTGQPPQLPDPWLTCRQEERALEADFNRLIEERDGTLYSWISRQGFRSGQERQRYVEAILKGYTFIEELIGLGEWADMLDPYEQRDRALRSTVSQVLERISLDCDERERLFARYRSLRRAVGYEL